MIDILSYGHTKRLHTVQTIGQQTVAEHSGRVALLADEMCGGKASANLLRACLRHDLAECITGDVPATVKWRNPELKRCLDQVEYEFECDNMLNVNLTIDEALILKYADGLELAFHAVDQMMLGNRNMEHVYHNIMHHIKHLPQLEIAEGLINLVEEKYHGATR